MRRMTECFLGLVLPGVLLTAAPITGQAEVLSNDHRQQVTFFEVDQCNGEDVQIDTEYHAIVRSKEGDDSGVVDFRVNAHGTAVGLTSGTTYIFNDTYASHDTWSGPTGSGKFVYYRRLVSPGSAANILITYHFRYTFDGADFVVVLDSLEFDCRG